MTKLTGGIDDLNMLVQEMDQVVLKSALEKINECPVLPLQCRLSDTVRKMRLRRISRIVYDRNEDTLAKFNNVFSSLHSCGTSLILVLKGCREHTEIFIGTNTLAGDAASNGAEAIATLDAAIRGNFPGIDLSHNLIDDEIRALLSPIQGDGFNAIASAAGVPSLKNDDSGTFSQGLEKIIDGMRGREFVAVIQATPVSRLELERVECGYQRIYSALSPFEQQQISLSENESRATGLAVAQGVTKTLSESIGETQSYTDGSSRSTSTTSGTTKSALDLKRAMSQAAGGAVAGAAMGAPTVIGAPIGAVAGALSGFAAGLFGGSTSTSESASESTNASQSFSSTATKTSSHANSTTHTDSSTDTRGNGRTLEFTAKNRQIIGLLAAIDEQLHRIDDCKNYGMWNWGAYFIGQGEMDVRLAADLYSGILRGDATGLERNSVAVWNRHSHEQQFVELQKYICQLRHPLFLMPQHFRTRELTHTALISSREMAVAMSLPQKSLPGIPVLDSVAFGRSVTHFGKSQPGPRIRIGALMNFGVADGASTVEIDVNSLAAHAFITGSTGSGKSNAVYSIVEALHSEHHIPFLIIEPAKGEYKHVFGGRDDVNVFGTNPKLMPLLRINPFSFPENTHVMEHIDRLIEILNAVWPMYAAMPAILKEAVEKVYEHLGWDLINSECCHQPAIFPDFYDLLDVLPSIISQSDYSQELKSNYAGALLTRVRSLTNGYYKTIFQKNELTLAQLFDKPCIVDLSRVGSGEAKSLLMGIIFLKLQEYRMSATDRSNANLKHVTVMEEAHTLLRRTSSAQGQEHANLQGKAVEMISNAIAEMRTYGEGFIIVDQAPGLLDQAVIRNTNTKIVFRLPDVDDRALVGKAANASDQQIDELSRLMTGCAAVYQNDWLEPVLCQFDFFERAKQAAFFHVQGNLRLLDQRKETLTKIIKKWVNLSLSGPNQFQDHCIEIPSDFHYFQEYRGMVISSMTDLENVVASAMKLSKVLDRVPKEPDVDVWLPAFIRVVGDELVKDMLDTTEHLELIRLLLNHIATKTPRNRQILEGRLLQMKQRIFEELS